MHEISFWIGFFVGSLLSGPIFDWVLRRIIRALSNAHADGSAVADTVRRDVGTEVK